MSLHGTIAINGTTLMTWSARRTTPEVSRVNTYEVGLHDVDGHLLRFGILDHTYADGALVLAARVLSWASGDAPTLPPSSRQRGPHTAKAAHDRRLCPADETDLRDDGDHHSTKETP